MDVDVDADGWFVDVNVGVNDSVHVDVDVYVNGDVYVDEVVRCCGFVCICVCEC